MKVYFLSSRPCALTINDAYFGLVDGFERFAEISLKDGFFLSFIPENALPISFFLTENVLSSPPDGCEIYLLREGIAIYARDFPPRELALRPVVQKRFGDILATVFFQGALQLSLNTPDGFFIAHLPPSFENCELFFENGLLLLRSPSQLAVYTKKGECVFCENVSSYRVEKDALYARLPLSDSLSRYADGEWKMSESGLVRTAYTLSQAHTQNGDICSEKIREELLPYAFFESVLLGTNFDGLLSDELTDEKERISGYLGDFKEVTLTQDPAVCGLIYEKAERLFEVRYFTVKTKEGKIADIVET